jgi:hypothetical protein
MPNSGRVIPSPTVDASIRTTFVEFVDPVTGEPIPMPGAAMALKAQEPLPDASGHKGEQRQMTNVTVVSDGKNWVVV